MAADPGRRRRRAVGAVVAAVILLAWGGSADAAPASVQTDNAAGYAVRGAPMDAVVMEFPVPAVTCTADNEAVSLVSGFGGLTEASLVRAGVQIRCSGTSPHYALVQQYSNGTGASTDGPAVGPGDYVRVVVCPTPGAVALGECASGSPATTSVMASVAYRRNGAADYTVWDESLVPHSWSNTRREAGCFVEYPRDAMTGTVLDPPRFSVPATRCAPYRTVLPAPPSRVDVANGGNGYAAYKLTIARPTTPTGSSSASPASSVTGKDAPPPDTDTTTETTTTETTITTVAPPAAPTAAGTSPTGDGNPFDDPQVSSGLAASTGRPIGSGPVQPVR